MNAVKKILGCILVLTVLAGLAAIGYADEDPESPSVDIADNSTSSSHAKYSAQEFDAFSDEEKREIYFNHPETLPDDFESCKYMDIMHPEQE